MGYVEWVYSKENFQKPENIKKKKKYILKEITNFDLSNPT